jgi:hypothetical protein
VSAIAKAAAETWLFLFALSISLGWSLLSDQLDGRQIVFLCSPFLYFIAGTCMPFYWNGTTTSSESYALILVRCVTIVVCFVLMIPDIVGHGVLSISRLLLVVRSDSCHGHDLQTTNSGGGTIAEFN